MDKKFLLAILLCFLVLYGWQALFPPPKPTPPPQAQPQKVTSAPSGSAAPATQPVPADQPPPVVEQTKPTVASAAAQDVVVENPFVRARFNTRGGTLHSWQLLKYQDGLGKPLELVPQNIPDAAKPFTLEVDDQVVSGKLRDALFKPDRESLTIGSESAQLTFEYRDENLVARKTFTFSPAHPYVMQFTAEVTHNGQELNPAVLWGPALGTGIISHGMSYAPPPQPIFYRDGKVNRIAIKNIDQHRQEQGAFGFAGVDDHYFLSAVIPSGQAVDVRYDPILPPVQGGTCWKP